MRTVVLCAIAALSWSSAACYSRYDVRPTELPKLGSAYEEKLVGAAWTGKTVIPVAATRYSAIKLIRTDGGVANVSGEAAVEIHSHGRIYDFAGPLLPEIEDGTLIMRDRLGEERFALPDIDRAVVVQHERTLTWIAIGGFSALAATVFLTALVY